MLTLECVHDKERSDNESPCSSHGQGNPQDEVSHNNVPDGDN